MSSKTVAVALSGGIDSMVAAFLLKKQAYDVTGIHFVTGYEKTPPDIDRLKDVLGMDIQTIDLSSRFQEQVVDYFVNSYKNGKTPNPCLVCNRDIKFGHLLTLVRSQGADFLATGHYAGIVKKTLKGVDSFSLVKGKDPVKDQSYFLSFLSSGQMAYVMFPLAGLTKSQVKETARSFNLSPVCVKESQDVCFIPGNDTSAFVASRLESPPGPGDIVTLSGQVIGQHNGLHAFTIGQRRGINCPAQQPYYVKEIDVVRNRLVVCFKQDLFSNKAGIVNLAWNEEPQNSCRVDVKIRSTHRPCPSMLYFENKGDKGRVIFDQPQMAVTPGQGAVFYRENRVLGAGFIQ